MLVEATVQGTDVRERAVQARICTGDLFVAATKHGLGGVRHPPGAVVDCGDNVAYVGGSPLRGGTWRRGAHTGNEMGDRLVFFVAAAGDGGHGKGKDRARDRLIVECPEVFLAATAPSDDRDVQILDA